MEFRVIIPARYESSRFPGKALAEIAGKPMIQHVYERSKASGASSVIIATDDQRIADAAEKFGAEVCITSEDHQSGTERLSEVVGSKEYDSDDIIVNVQGDEPLIPPEVILKVAQDMEEHDTAKVCSICLPIGSREEALDPNVVKVQLSRRHFAMTFSRAALPWQPALDTTDPKTPLELEHIYYRHIGLYGYRSGFLQQYVELPPSPFEHLESLEQLRILWNGMRIHMAIYEGQIPPSVDTPEDLDKIKKLLKR